MRSLLKKTNVGVIFLVLGVVVALIFLLLWYTSKQGTVTPPDTDGTGVETPDDGYVDGGADDRQDGGVNGEPTPMEVDPDDLIDLGTFYPTPRENVDVGFQDDAYFMIGDDRVKFGMPLSYYTSDIGLWVIEGVDSESEVDAYGGQLTQLGFLSNKASSVLMAVSNFTDENAMLLNCIVTYIGISWDADIAASISYRGVDFTAEYDSIIDLLGEPYKIDMVDSEGETVRLIYQDIVYSEDEDFALTVCFFIVGSAIAAIEFSVIALYN